MYSIEVLKEAIKKEVRGARLTRLMHPSQSAVRRNPTLAAGFLMHKSEHWFALRRVHGKFWLLNRCVLMLTTVLVQSACSAGLTSHFSKLGFGFGHGGHRLCGPCPKDSAKLAETTPAAHLE